MEVKLSPEAQKLILHWGEMGSQWGLSRSTSQVFALLYFTQQSLTAEQICDTLSLARSNVSTSLKELVQDGVIQRVSKLGERSDYFKALSDVWETLQRVAAIRRKKELDPSIAMMRSVIKEIDAGKEKDTPMRRQAADMLKFLELAASWSDEFQRYSPKALARLSGMANQILKLVRSAIGAPAKQTKRHS